ncbi:TRAP transporter small permease [Pontibacterium granulatum]|uniref:TRAP transporter small permease n=1 Tax=Pontibacterium granulatum TaxID=2036029 RepID=UPI00249BF5FF|nr:TRAP transporter small permease [Pontibacterium granulatum]MDI3324559.1 TRAP transporter small permease [Pontibacterium granulatum]
MSHQVFHRLNQLDHWLGRIEAFSLSAGILLMALNTIVNVFGRYLFSQSLYFSEELNQMLMVWITFMGLGYVTRKGRHIRMSAIYDLLSDRNKKLLMLLITLSTALTLFLLSYYASLYVAKMARRGMLTAALQIPMYWTLLVVPLGFLIGGLQYSLAFVRNLRSPDIYLSYHALDVYDESQQSQSI